MVEPELEIEDPFVVYTRVNGRLAKTLIDCGCNTSMMDRAYAKKIGARIHRIEEVPVNWGNSGGVFAGSEVAVVDVVLKGDFGKGNAEVKSKVFLLAPLRVDLILGLPLFKWLNDLSLKDERVHRYMEFTHKPGERMRLTAKPTNRRWEKPTCNAAHLREWGRTRSRFTPATKPFSWVLTESQLARLVRKKSVAQVFAVLVRRWDEAQLVQPVQVDPLETIAQDHPLRTVLEKYRHDLFRENTDLPPDRGEDNFRIEMLPGSKPAFLPLRHMAQRTPAFN
ncbi:hypothetical protein DFS34DRAFT_676003 [Phlyctochytrium arcticum]|nr:hypothetical protein DFS34DRAFT_676003 [Phlyctochytrium arcticum]